MSTATITPDTTVGTDALESVKNTFVKAFIAIKTAGNTVAASRNAHTAINTAKALGTTRVGFFGASFSLAMLSMKTTYKLTTAAEGNVIAFPIRLVSYGLRFAGWVSRTISPGPDSKRGKVGSWLKVTADQVADFATKVTNGYRSVMEHSAVVNVVVWTARVVGLVLIANAIAGGAIAAAALSVPVVGVGLSLLASSPVFALFALAFLQGTAAMAVMVFDHKRAFSGINDPQAVNQALIKDAKAEFGWLWKIVSYPFRKKTVADEAEAFLAEQTTTTEVDGQLSMDTVEFVSDVEYGPITQEEALYEAEAASPVVVLANQAESLDEAVAILRNGARVHYHSGITSVVAPATGDQLMAWVMSAHNAAQAKTRMQAVDSPFTRGPRVELHKPDINIPASAADRIMHKAGAGKAAGKPRKKARK